MPHPVAGADVATIARTRSFLATLAAAFDADGEQIELALARLVELELDEETLAGFQSTQEDARRAAGRCRVTIAVLDARHQPLEDAVNATPDAARTDFYRADGGPARHDEPGNPAVTMVNRDEGAPEEAAVVPTSQLDDADRPAGSGPEATQDRNTLGIPNTPGTEDIVSSTFIETDPGTGSGVAYLVEASDPDDPYVWLTVGTRAEAIKQMSPWPGGRVPLDGEEDLAFLDDEATTTLGRRLLAAAKAAETGRVFTTKTVTGADGGDVEVEVVGDQVRVTVVPYGLDEPYEEPYAPEPLTEVETDEGELRKPTDEELADWLAEERALYDAEVAKHDAARAARRQRLTTVLSGSQARQLRAGLVADLTAPRSV